jgi:hypothetical protein
VVLLGGERAVGVGAEMGRHAVVRVARSCVGWMPGAWLSGLRRSCAGAEVVPARLDVWAPLSRIGIADAAGTARATIASATVMMRGVVEVMAGSVRDAGYNAPSTR